MDAWMMNQISGKSAIESDEEEMNVFNLIQTQYEKLEFKMNACISAVVVSPNEKWLACGTQSSAQGYGTAVFSLRDSNNFTSNDAFYFVRGVTSALNLAFSHDSSLLFILDEMDRFFCFELPQEIPNEKTVISFPLWVWRFSSPCTAMSMCINDQELLESEKNLACFCLSQSLSVVVMKIGKQGLEQICEIETGAMATSCGMLRPGVNLGRPRVAVGNNQGSCFLYKLPKYNDCLRSPESEESEQKNSNLFCSRTSGSYEKKYGSGVISASFLPAKQKLVMDSSVQPLGTMETNALGFDSFYASRRDTSKTPGGLSLGRRTTSMMCQQAGKTNIAKGIELLFVVANCGSRVNCIAASVKRRGETVAYSVGHEVIVIQKVEQESEISRKNIIRTLSGKEQWHITSRLNSPGWSLVTCLALSSDGKAMAVGAWDSDDSDTHSASLTVYNMKQVLPTKRIYRLDPPSVPHKGKARPTIKAVCFSKNGLVTYSGGTNQTLLIDTVNSGVSINGLQDLEQDVVSVTLNEEGTRLAACVQSDTFEPTKLANKVLVYNVQEIEKATRNNPTIEPCKAVFEHIQPEYIHDALLSKDGRLLVIAIDHKLLIFKEYHNESSRGWIEISSIVLSRKFKVMDTATDDTTKIIYLAIASADKVQLFFTSNFSEENEIQSNQRRMQEINIPDEPLVLKDDVDDVQAIALARNASVLVVTKRASIYCFHIKEQTMIHNRRYDDFQSVFNSVSLSPTGDLLATGNSMGKLMIYDLKKKRVVASIQKPAPILYVQFLTSSYIVFMFAGKRSVLISEMNNLDSSVTLPTTMPCTIERPNIVSVSQAGTLAAFTKTQIYIYGFCTPGMGHKIYDAPGYPLFEEIMHQPNDLYYLLKHHPFMANRVCPRTSKDVVQICVEKHLHESLNVLLESDCPIALHFDENQETAISQAILSSNPIIWLRLILHGIVSKKISNDHETLSILIQGHVKLPKEEMSMNIFEYLGLNYPRLLLEFLSSLQMAELDESLLHGFERTEISSPEYVTHSQKHGHEVWDALKGNNMMETIDMVMDGLTSNKLHKPMKAGLLPIKGITMPLHRQNSKYVSYKVTPLQVIVKACKLEDDASIFSKGSVAHHILECQWQLLKANFRREVKLFLFYIAMASINVYLLTIHKQKLASSDHQNQKQGYSPLHIGIICFNVLLIVMSCFFLTWEIHELLVDYRWTGNLLKSIRSYLSFSNITDLLSFVIQIVVSIVFLILSNIEASPERIVKTAAVGLLIMYTKLLYYAQGFTEWAKSVKMIGMIMILMRRYFAIMLLIGIGFAFAFTALLSESVDGFDNPLMTIRSLSLYFYGAEDSVLDVISEGGTALFIFEVFMIMEIIILLNLMITVMADSFHTVKEKAGIIILLNKAELVVQLEHQYRLFNHGKSVKSKGCSSEYPWVHVLEPVKKPKGDEHQDSLARLEAKVDQLSKTMEERLKNNESRIFSVLMQCVENLEMALAKRNNTSHQEDHGNKRLFNLSH